MKENRNFSEKEKITDLLFGEKYLTGCYNSFLLEAATPEIKKCLGEMLTDTHRMQQQIFEEMNSRGWYQVTKAEEQKINETKSRMANCGGQS